MRDGPHIAGMWNDMDDALFMMFASIVSSTIKVVIICLVVWSGIGAGERVATRFIDATHPTTEMRKP